MVQVGVIAFRKEVSFLRLLARIVFRFFVPMGDGAHQTHRQPLDGKEAASRGVDKLCVRAQLAFLTL